MLAGKDEKVLMVVLFKKDKQIKPYKNLLPHSAKRVTIITLIVRYSSDGNYK